MRKSSAILAVLVVAVCSFPQASWAQTAPMLPAPPAPKAPVAPAEPARPGTPEYAYRLHYTLTEMNGGKQVDVQHLSLTVAPGQSNNSINMSSRVPVPAGPQHPGTASIGVQTQFQILDVGTRIDASIKMLYEGVQVTTSVNQSRLAEVPVGDGTMTIIRQANLDSSVILSPGKLVRIGSMDVPGGTQHLDVDLMLEEVK